MKGFEEADEMMKSQDADSLSTSRFTHLTCYSVLCGSLGAVTSALVADCPHPTGHRSTACPHHGTRPTISVPKREEDDMSTFYVDAMSPVSVESLNIQCYIYFTSF
ncbi:hypothetical protein E3N88_08570 [Mikania micrantha]|uniref:Uncharacterized protein n=1 Tax=Mikania micrantha TaxID=192012 RepID=A0A5N6PGN3_9ASTR|nr:hypothetical protein E3N88_08570 [Mikania micrantha]